MKFRLSRVLGDNMIHKLYNRIFHAPSNLNCPMSVPGNGQMRPV
jgi:hypothetical protein